MQPREQTQTLPSPAKHNAAPTLAVDLREDERQEWARKLREMELEMERKRQEYERQVDELRRSQEMLLRSQEELLQQRELAKSKEEFRIIQYEEIEIMDEIGKSCSCLFI